MQIVPSGREGVFTSIAQVPRILMGVLLTSAGGWLLAAHCPPTPLAACVAGGGRMWLLVAAVSAITPVGLALRAAIGARAAPTEAAATANPEEEEEGEEAEEEDTRLEIV